MKSQTKEVLSGLGCITVLLLAGAAALLYWITLFGFAPSPSSTFYEDFPGPNQEMKAVVFERNAGATTGFSTQGSLIDANEDLPDSDGNVLGMDGHPDHTEIGVVWISEHKVRVSYSLGYGNRIWHKNEHVGDIAIEFRENK